MKVGRERQERLLQAALALASDLALPHVLQMIVDLAAELTLARYGALGVLGADGVITEFITTGLSDEERRRIGHIPHGDGILGVLIKEAKPLRLADLAEHPQSVGFPAQHPPMRSFLGAPVQARGIVFGNIYLTEKRGSDAFTEEDEESLVLLASQAGAAIANARLYDDSRRRESLMESLKEVSDRILAGSQVDEVLRLIASRARELLNADLCTFVTATAVGDLQLTVAEGVGADALAGLTVPIEGSVSGDVIKSMRTLVLEDARNDPRTFQPMVQRGDMGPTVFVPLVVRGQAIGTLAVANRVGGRLFTPEDVGLLESFATQASVALEYARAQGELERLLLVDERERIARELHDGVIQSLFAVGMGLQGAAMVTSDVAVQTRIDRAVAEVDNVIRDIRNYIFGLRPGILADRHLEQALRELGEDFEQRTGITTVVQVDPVVAAELSSRSHDVVQVAREALSNIQKHANATTSRVTLGRADGVAFLEIDDDGRGMQRPARRRGREGQGIPNLAARAEALGGVLEVVSNDGAGTLVRMTVPLDSSGLTRQ